MDATESERKRWKSTLAAAKMAYESGQLRQAAALFGRLRYMVSGGPDRDFAMGVADLGLGVVYLAEGRLDEAQKQLELVMRSSGTSAQPELCEVHALALRYHAQLLMERGERSGAEEELKECIEILTKLGPAFGAQLSYAINDLSILYALQGDFAQAERYIVESVNMLSVLLGTEHPEYQRADTIYKIATATSEHERSVLAECGLVRSQYLLGAHHPDLVRGLKRLITVLRESGQQERLAELKENFSAIERDLKL